MREKVFRRAIVIYLTHITIVTLCGLAALFPSFDLQKMPSVLNIRSWRAAEKRRRNGKDTAPVLRVPGTNAAGLKRIQGGPGMARRRDQRLSLAGGAVRVRWFGRGRV